MNLSHKKLIILSAPSGSGKTTFTIRLIKDFHDLVLSISTTTRPKRSYEKEGEHYFFVTESKFTSLIEDGYFIEYALVHGFRYGTQKKTVETLLKEGKNILFDIDVQGAMALKKLYNEDAILIFILPPSLEVLKDRLLKRGEDKEAIDMRIKNAEQELSYQNYFDFLVVNEDLEKAYKEIKTIVGKALNNKHNKR